MEVHCQSPVGPTRTVYPLTPPAPTRRPIKSPHTATPPFQSRSIQSPTRKVTKCRPTNHEVGLTQFDALLESYNDWLALHPTPTPSPSISTAGYTTHSSLIGDYPSLSQLAVSSSNKQEPSSSIAESSYSWQHNGLEKEKDIAIPNTSLNPSHPKHYILHQNTVSSRSNRVLTQTQVDTTTTSILLPIKLEDLLSESDTSKSSNDNSIRSPTYRPLDVTLLPVVTNGSPSGALHKNVSSTTLKKSSSEAGTLLSNRFYRHHLLCWGVRSLVHNVLRGRRLKGVAIAHYQLVRLRNGWRKWKRKTEKQRLKVVQSKTMASEFCSTKTLEKGFLVWQAWTLHKREIRDKAIALLKQIQKKKFFVNWRRYTSSTVRYRNATISALNTTKERMVLTRSMLVWREDLRLRQYTQTAEKIFAKNHKRRVFQAWRLHIYQCNLKQLCEAYTRQKSMTLLQACFNQWVFQAALRVGDSVLCTKLHAVWQFTLCQKTFNGWSKVTRLSKVYRTTVSLHSKRILKSCFSQWKESHLLCHLQELHGITQIQQLKKKQIFDKWRTALSQRRNEKAATHFHSSKCLKRVWHFMKDEYSRLTQLRQAMVRKERCLLSECMSTWKLANKNKVGITMALSADQLLQVHTLRRCLSLWRGIVVQKMAKLKECTNSLGIKLRKHMLAQWLNIWRRQLQSQRLARIHRKKKLLHMVRQCLTNWRDHTVLCYTDISMHFASEMQHALNIDPLTTYETMESCLATILLNLGLIGESDFKQIVTHSNIDRPLRLLSNPLDVPTHSTPVAYRMFEHQELSRERSSIKFVSDLSNSYETCPMSHHSTRCPDPILRHSETTVEPIVPFQPFTDDDFKSSPLPKLHQNVSSQAELTAIDGTHTTVDCYTSSMGCSFNTHSQLCTCLRPDVAKNIHDVKQKLEDLSTSLESFNENTFITTQSCTTEHSECSVELPLWSSLSGEKNNKMEVSGELDDNQSPILTPPPEFAIENDRGMPDESHITCFPCYDTQVQSIAMQVPAIVATAVSCVRNLRLYPCNIAFHSWRSYSAKQFHLRKELNRARNYSRLEHLRSAFDAWKERSSQTAALNCLEKQLKSTSRHNLLNSVMETWKKHQQRQTDFQNMEARAESFHRLCHMRKHLKSWKDHCDHVIGTKIAKTKRLQEVIALRSVFKCWVIQATKRHLAKKMGLRWKQTAKVLKQERQAFNLLRYYLMSRVWTRWRIALVREKISIQSAHHNKQLLLKQVFTAWQVVVTNPSSYNN